MTEHKYTVYPYDILSEYVYDRKTGAETKVPTISNSTTAFYCNAQNLDDIKKAMELLGVQEYTVNTNDASSMSGKEIFATSLVISTRKRYDKDRQERNEEMEALALSFNQHSPLFWKEQFGRFTVTIVRATQAVYSSQWSHNKMERGSIDVVVMYDDKLVKSAFRDRTFELNLYRYVTRDGKVLKKAFYQNEVSGLPEEIRLNDAISVETLVSNIAHIAKARSQIVSQYRIY